MRRRRSKSDMITSPAATLCKFGMPLALLSSLLFASPATSQSDEEAAGPAPLLVVFGPAAPQSEGDHDWRQFIRFSVPEDAGRFFVRVFDPDVGGAHDEFLRGFGTETRFTLYGADATATLFRDPDGAIQEAVEGRSLETVTYGESPAADGRWNTLFAADAAQGRAVDGRREFVLAVEGVEGADGNVFEVAVAIPDGSNEPPAGLRLYSYLPTFQVAQKGQLTELRFDIPEEAEALAIENFDSAGGRVNYDGEFRSVPLAASGKSEWVRAVVPLEAEERGRIGSVTVAEGGETPNDVTVFVGYPNGGDDTIEHPIAIDLPVRAFNRNRRPLIDINVSQTACHEMQFDASQSSDPDGGALSYTWRFDTGNGPLEGAKTRIRFDETGDHRGRLEVFDDSGRVAAGRASEFNFYVKPPPIARIRAPSLVALNQEVRIDGTGSTTLPRPAGNRITRYHWRLGDGTEIVQRPEDADFGVPVHRYASPGIYTIELTVTDDEGNPCNVDSTTHTIRVNEAPVADAGGDQRLAYGEILQLDAGATTGADGDPHSFHWAFGDGNTATGASVEHQFAKAGTYAVTLTVDDGTGVANGVSSDQIEVFVNAAPIARDLTIPETLVPGAAGVFDATGTIDPEGGNVAVRWRFDDGVSSDSAALRRSFDSPGTYEVAVDLTDPSGLSNATTTVVREIRVVEPDNQTPVADAGAARLALVGEPVVLDATRSRDPDGSILTYRWDFGDGTGSDRVVTTHVYHQPGTYTVTLDVVDDSGKENDSASDSFEIVVAHKDNISPRVSVGQHRAAFVNEILEFDATGTLDVDGNLVAIEWDFGDGARASGFKVFHSYAEPGLYPVKVLVRDDSGRRGSVATADFTVSVTHAPNKAPEVDLASLLQLHTEVPHLFDASGAGDPDGRIVSYRWDFGDGGTSNRPVVEHVYSRPGTYEGSLTLTDNSGLENGITTLRFSAIVRERPNEQPIAEAGPDRFAVVGRPVTFDGGGSADRDGSLIRYHWDFGNGKTAVGQRRSIAYFSPGRYDVTLTVTDNSGQDNADHTDTLTVVVRDRENDTPIAKLEDDRPAAIDEPVPFTASASGDADGNIISYEWDFGDGNKASGREVVHQYDKPGVYRTRLIIRDDSGLANEASFDERVITVNDPPVAEAGKEQLVTASQVLFDASGSKDPDGKIILYAWDFGDGHTGSGRKITHTYRSPGTYTVHLKVTDDSGTIRNVAADATLVTVNALPVADAGFDLVTSPGDTVVFDGRRSVDPDGEIKRFAWNFRDGNTAEGDVVEHSFEKPGLYAVNLQVFDDTGHSEATDFSQILVTVNHPPVAEAGPDLLVAPGEVFTLSGARSTDEDGEISGWRWDIHGSDETLEGRTVEHRFNQPGIYSIGLTVTDDSIASNRTAQDQLTVRVNHSPVAEAGENVISGALRVVFDANASADPDNDGLSYVWNLGDGNVAHGAVVEHTYETGGIYPVRLTADDGTGVANARDTDALTVSINRQPKAVAGENQQACVGDVFVFDASSSIDPDGGLLSYDWDFGDGEKATIINPTKIFGAAGAYRVLLDVTDESGLPNASHRDEILATVLPAPVAHAGNDMEICAGTTVRFDGTKSTDVDGVVNRYSWDFGDGQSGGGDRPEHMFSDAGIYRVTLQIEGDNLGICSPVSSDDLTVTVLDAPVAVITARSAAAIGEVIEFDGLKSTSKSAAISGYEWDFGDGMTAKGIKVSHAFEKPGVYGVRLRALADEEAGGCSSAEVVHLVTVNEAPVAKIDTKPAVEIHRPLTLSAAGSSDSDGGIAAYHWDFGDGNKSDGIEVSHIWREAGPYIVTLTVDDGKSLKNSRHSVKFEVDVTPAPPIEIAVSQMACPGEVLQFDLANLPDTVDPETPRWEFGDGTGLAGKQTSHAYSRPGTYSVSVATPVDRAGNRLVTPFAKNVTINRRPVALFNAPRKSCAGTQVAFDASDSFDADNGLKHYHWDFGDGKTAEGMQVSHSYAQPGIYWPRLTVTDGSGSVCSTATETVDVLVNAPPVADAGPDVDLLFGGAHDSLVLDASRSSDPDGDTLIYYWTLSNGVEVDGERARVEFSEAGEVTALLTAADPHGLDCSFAEDTVKIRTTQRERSTPQTE